MKTAFRNCVIFAATSCVLLSSSAFAQQVGEIPSPNSSRAEVTDPIAAHWLGQASRSLAAEREKTVPDISDPAFDVYVQPALIGQAYAAGDAALLTDVALQLAEGERVLLRSRKGITSAQIVQLAVNAAGQKQDKRSLQRLAKFAELRGDKQLAGQVAAAEKLAAVSRDTTSRMMVPIEVMEVEDFARLRYCVQKIDQARLTGDSRCLIALHEDIQSCIPDPFRGNLEKLITEARASIPPESAANEQFVGVLTRLAQISRDLVPPYDPENDPASEPVPVTGTF